MDGGGRPVEGVILAAGYGERMRPLTDDIPKALLPVAGVPLLRVIARKMVRAGASKVHVNLFHLGERIRNALEGEDIPFVWHEEEELLDTGGGVGNMAVSLSGAEDIILCNGDICSSIDLGEVLAAHRDRGGLVTLVLLRPTGGGSHTAPPPSVTLDGEGRITGIGPPEDLEGGAEAAFGYTGISALSASALEYFPRERAGLVGILRSMIEDRPCSASGWDASLGSSAPLWGETGTPSSYLDLHRRILVDKEVFDELLMPPPLPLRAGEGSRIDPSARWKGFLDVGRGAVIEKDTVLADCVVLDGARVPAGARLESAIVGTDSKLEVE